MVTAKRRRSYHDSHTGERKIDNVLICPRYDRQWRNLWFGGWSHEGLLLDEDGYLTLTGLGWR